jgi:branched-chain amino acid transport system permease protein
MNAHKWHLTQASLGALTLFVIVAAGSLLYASIGGSQRNVATVLLINLIIVVGLQVFAGNSGVLSLAHVAFAGIGAYASALLSTPVAVKAATIPNAPFGLAEVQLPVPLAMLVAVIIATLVAAVLGLAIARLSGISATIVTLALVIVVFAVLTNWKALTGGAEAFYGIPSVTSIWWVLGGVAVALFTARLFKASRLGLRVQATREDEIAASASGVRVVRSRYVAWLVSAAICALGGVLLGHYLGAISPSGFYFNLLFLTLAMLVLGGEYSVSGAVLGTVLVAAVAEITRFLGDGPTVLGIKIPSLAGLSQLVQGGIIILVMIVRPAGILGDEEVDRLFGPLLRRLRPEAVTPASSGGSEPRGAAHGGVARAASSSAALAASDGGPPLLEVSAVSKHFAGLKALEQVSLDVKVGEIVGLIGPNGAGKTTLLNVISGMYTATSGEIRMGGSRITHLKPHEIARQGIARTFQNTRLFRELTVRQNVEVAASVSSERGIGSALSVDDILAEFGFEDIGDRKAGELPYGRQREVEMARAVALAPTFLLLDEPAAGLNDTESQELVGAVRQIRERLGCGVLLIDHDLHFVMNICDRMYVLDAGVVIASGTPQEVQRDPVVIRAYLGTRGQCAPPTGDRGLSGSGELDVET